MEGRRGVISLALALVLGLGFLALENSDGTLGIRALSPMVRQWLRRAPEPTHHPKTSLYAPEEPDKGGRLSEEEITGEEMRVLGPCLKAQVRLAMVAGNEVLAPSADCRTDRLGSKLFSCRPPPDHTKNPGVTVSPELI
jgi:hypothetical protein